MKKPLAFVLMPFDSAFDDIYRLGIKETADRVGVLAERLDEQMFVEGMLDRIYQQIELSDLIIADMTGKNANVFYEVGYAHAKGKLCILLTGDAKDIPFDLKHRKHIVYSSISSLRQDLERHLEWAKAECLRVQGGHLRIDHQIQSTYMQVRGFTAEAVVDIVIDLHNDSHYEMADLDASYLFSSDSWSFRQSGDDCPRTSSRQPPYQTTYMVKAPVPRLPGDGWAQIRLTAVRFLDTKWSGNPLKDQYAIDDRFLLRFVNTKHHFDFEIPVQFNVVNAGKLIYEDDASNRPSKIRRRALYQPFRKRRH